MENRPKLNVNIREYDGRKDKVSSPAVFMCPSKNALSMAPSNESKAYNINARV